MTNDSKVWIAQIDELLNEFEVFSNRSKYDDLSDIDDGVPVPAFIMRVEALVARICRPDSAYAKRAALQQSFVGARAVHLASVMNALRADMQMGYLRSFSEILHADLFSDYLEMASHLNESGYKDAAAVIIGSTLESHLRQLSAKFGVPLVVPTPNGDRPKKADAVNADLAKGGAYGRFEQKQITAWLDLRNNAAHGDYAKYGADQVGLLLEGVRSFIAKFPA